MQDFIVSYVHYSEKGPAHDYYSDDVVHAKDSEEARDIFEAEHDRCDHIITVEPYL